MQTSIEKRSHPRRKFDDSDERKMYDRVVGEGEKVEVVAVDFGCHPNTVKNAIRRVSSPKKDEAPAPEKDTRATKQSNSTSSQGQGASEKSI